MHEAKKHGDADFAVTLLRDCSRGNKKTQAWFVPVAVTILVEADRLKEASLITKVILQLCSNISMFISLMLLRSCL